MDLAAHEQAVVHYYDVNTPTFYLEGWDQEHIHFGIFDPAKDALYRSDPVKALEDRRDPVLRMTDLIVESARIVDCETVADAGCGVGGTALLIAERNPNSRVIGLNINDMQLDIARTRAAESGLADRVTFEWCDCSQHIPLPDSSVDVIINIESACHYSNRARFIEECARVLRRGGRLAAQDWVTADDLSEADRARAIKPLEASWYLKDLESLASYRVLLEGAGLRVTYAEHIEEGMMPNAYIIAMGYHSWNALAKQRPLTQHELDTQERMRTFAESFLGGELKIGHYVAEKP